MTIFYISHSFFSVFHTIFFNSLVSKTAAWILFLILYLVQCPNFLVFSSLKASPLYKKLHKFSTKRHRRVTSQYKRSSLSSCAAVISHYLVMKGVFVVSDASDGSELVLLLKEMRSFIPGFLKGVASSCCWSEFRKRGCETQIFLSHCVSVLWPSRAAVSGLTAPSGGKLSDGRLPRPLRRSAPVSSPSSISLLSFYVCPHFCGASTWRNVGKGFRRVKKKTENFQKS